MDRFCLTLLEGCCLKGGVKGRGGGEGLDGWVWGRMKGGSLLAVRASWHGICTVGDVRRKMKSFSTCQLCHTRI